MAYRKSLLILAFLALASWLAPEPVAGYTYCEHKKANGTIGKHCPPCGHTGKDTSKSALGSTCLLASSNSFTGLEHLIPKREYHCTAAEGSGAIVDDSQGGGTFSWDFGISEDPADLVTCTELVDTNGDGTVDTPGDSGLFIISGSATGGLNPTCVAVTGEPGIQSRLIYRGFCANNEPTAVSETITLVHDATVAEFGSRPSWCPATGICELAVVSPGLPDPTNKQSCQNAFPGESGSGALASTEIARYSIGFAAPGCTGAAAPEIYRARGCTTQSWDPLTAEPPSECLVTVSRKIHRHVLNDRGSGGRECGPGSGSLKESFEFQDCKTSAAFKYRCFPRRRLATPRGSTPG